MNYLHHYVAGLIDGEGSLGLYSQGPNRGLRPVVTIAMADRECLDAVRTYFGGHIKSKPARDHRQVMFVWTTQGGSAKGFLARIQPHLVIQRRRDLIQLILDKWQPGTPGNNRLPQQQALKAEMSKRNEARQAALPEFVKTAPDRGDLAYLAGVLDGEGWVDEEKPRFQVHSTDPELPAWIKSRFGGEVGLVHPARGRRRALYRWWSHKSQTMRHAPGLLEYLRVPSKREKIQAWTAKPEIPDWLEPHLPGTSGDISKASGKPHPTVCTQLKALAKQGVLVAEGTQPTRKAGRPPVFYRISPSHGGAGGQ